MLAAAAVAAVSADLMWYGVGHCRGARAIGVLYGVSQERAMHADRVLHFYRGHELAFQFWARFVPELNPIAAGLAGATGVAFGRYFVVAGASAMTWAGAWTTAGYLLPNVVSHITVHIGVPVAVALATLTPAALTAISWIRSRPAFSVAPAGTHEAYRALARSKAIGTADGST
jgi:membrane protein DedA with SNARE-associated domain